MKKLLICLEYDGRVIHEGKSSELTLPLEIGRSPSCPWSVEGIDKTMSSRHAELFLKRGAVWIRDTESRNGITFAGERIAKKKLKSGDKLHLGGCILTVEEVKDRSGGDFLQYHRLEQLNGPRAGTAFDLMGGEDITVGSDPSSAINCLDPLVSRNHAALALKADGSCWVRDLGSKNGTTVNGVALAKGKERMLRDGDILSVAYIEFRFTDKDVAHPRAHMLRKVGIAFATVAIALIGYYTYATVKPSSRMLLRTALRYAEAERFGEARDYVLKAAEARGAEAYAKHRQEVMQNLEVWERTAKTWEKIRGQLSARDWDGAQMESVHLGAWDWNSSTAPREGLRAEKALDLVRAFRAAQKALSDGLGIADLEKDSGALAAAQGELAAVAANQPWAEPLLQDAATIQPELDATARELRRVEAAVRDLKPGPVNELPHAAGEALAALDALLAENAARKTATEEARRVFTPSHAVEARIGELRAPLRAFAASERVFAGNLRGIASAKFADVSADLPLPSAQLAGMVSSFPEYAADLQRRNDVLCKETLVGWRDRLRNVSQTGFDPDGRKYPAALKALLSEKVSKKVLEFVPSASREVVVAGADGPLEDCAYDAFVGIYEFYYFLEEIDPESPSERAIARYGGYDEGRWETVVQVARDVCAKLGAFVSYRNASGEAGTLARLVASVDVPGGGNEIEKALRFADEILREKEAWAADMFKGLCAAEGSGRAAILARGVKVLLAAKPDREETKALAAEWAKFKRGIPKWNGTETAARDIFNEALPGMSLHRKAWQYLRREAE